MNGLHVNQNNQADADKEDNRDNNEQRVRRNEISKSHPPFTIR